MQPIMEYFEQKFLDILEFMSEGIFIANLNYEVVYLNEAYSKFVGHDKKEVIGANIREFRPGTYLPEMYRNKQPLYNVPRVVNGVKTYCDYIPIIHENNMLGGLVIVKDAMRILELSLQLKEREEKIFQLNAAVSSAFKVAARFDDIVGSSSGVKSAIELAYKAAKSDSYVLLLGESGTGKDVMAQAIHNESKRKNHPFIDINCAALPEHLLESELFGYIGGAFTGSNKQGKTGLFEIADGGTVFLDEIAEMPFNLQAKLLRVLQEKKIRRIGSEKSIPIDVCIIAATNQNIFSLINLNRFREDLYYRLAVFVINMPPLRERKEDIRLLMEKFLQEQQKKRGKHMVIGSDAAKVLMKYDWPGNIRELKNTIEYASGVVEDTEITLLDLPQNIIKKIVTNYTFKRESFGISLEKIVSDVEKQVIQEYLITYGHDGIAKKKIADDLNISVATLYNKINKYEI